MIAVTGACIVFARLPSRSIGSKRALVSFDLRKRIRIGLQLALVGPIFASSHSAWSSASLTGLSCQPLCVRAARNRASSAASSSILLIVPLCAIARPCNKGAATGGALLSLPGNRPGSDRADFLHFRDVMLQHVLNAGLERRRRAWTARARALHVQVDDAVGEIVTDDVAAVLRHGRPHARLEQLLDLGDDLGIGLAVLAGALGHPVRGQQDRPPGGEMLHDDAKNRRLELVPVALLVLRHGDEVAAEEDAGHAADRKEPFGQRPACGCRGCIGEIRGAAGDDRASREEFERRWIGGQLGLDEHRIFSGDFWTGAASPPSLLAWEKPPGFQPFRFCGYWRRATKCSRVSPVPA